MRLHDTARGAVRRLEPGPGPVSLYVCGITPYEAAHLGHAFTYHVFDVLTRRLRAAGHEVRSVRNVTDVDDDILRVARRRAIPWPELVDSQVSRFDADMAAIDLLPVEAAPRASEHVGDMVALVARLLDGGFAYEREGFVYFEVARFARYGELSRLGRERMIALSRDRGADPDDPRKRDSLDFVLWQPSLEDEPRWSSPWGEGRPGWHIECSALSRGALGPVIDIHGGGDDLVYPHHECEIAQSEALGPRPFARHWVHVAMVELDGTKMSKSLGNLVFVRDLLGEASPAAVRLMLADHHYRTAWGYQPAAMRGARSREAAWREAIAGGGAPGQAVVAACERAFWDRLDDDLDTPGAARQLDRLAAATASAAPGEPEASGGRALARLARVLGVALDAAESPRAAPA